MKKGSRKLALIIAALLLFVVFMIFILVNSSPPQILSASVYPEKVMPGQVMIVTVQAKDTLGIKSAIAIFENEKMPDERSIPLITGTRRDGVYETRWIVHDTKAQGWYNTTIIFTDILGKETQQAIAWQDPTVSHKADEITAGTFGAGNFYFQNNLNVTGGFNSSLIYTSGGNVGIGTTSPAAKLEVAGAINATGDIYTATWVDYSASSTIVGWSSFSFKEIYYKKIGKTVFCSFEITGTSNSAIATFTLPYQAAAGLDNLVFMTQVKDSGSYSVNPGTGYTNSGSNLIILNKDLTGAVFTTSGTKEINGEFWYEAAS
jgi:hypothetical protein